MNSNFDSGRWQISWKGVTICISSGCYCIYFRHWLTIVIATVIIHSRRKVQNRMYIGYKYLRNADHCVTLTIVMRKYWQISNKTHDLRSDFGQEQSIISYFTHFIPMSRVLRRKTQAIYLLWIISNWIQKHCPFGKKIWMKKNMLIFRFLYNYFISRVWIAMHVSWCMYAYSAAKNCTWVMVSISEHTRSNVI